MLQQQWGRLQRDGQRDQVRASVPAVELAVPSQPHLPGCPLPGAQRGSLLLPQPWEQPRGPVVLHARRSGPHGALWHFHLWWDSKNNSFLWLKIEKLIFSVGKIVLIQIVFFILHKYGMLVKHFYVVLYGEDFQIGIWFLTPQIITTRRVATWRSCTSWFPALPSP